MPPTAKAKRRRTPAATLKRQKLVQRLWSAAEAQVADIETRLAALDGDGATLERDARALGLLAKFLKELVGIECLLKEATAPLKPITKSVEDDDAPPRDLDAFRAELARRLDQMRGRGKPAGGSDKPQP